jgi:hypothetical protein
MRTLVLSLAFALGGAGVAGCGAVVSEEPASDATTSEVDDRLVGFWRVDWAASAPPSGRPGEPPPDVIFAVGRRSGPEPFLELAYVGLRKDRTLEVSKEELRTTTIAGLRHASLFEASPGAWHVLRYDVLDDATLRVFGLDEKKVAADVREGAVEGRVDRGPPVLTASTAELGSWLERRGDAVYRTESPLVLRRIRFD